MDKKKSSPKKNTGGGFGGMSSSSTKDSFPYAGSIRPGVQSPQRIVLDESIVKPDYYQDGNPKKGSGSPLLPWMIEVKTPEEIEKMRASGQLARQILDLAGRAVQVGITTDEIDALVHDAIVKVR
jgi:methionyl aminopeptidase